MANAVKYSPPGAEVLVAVRVEQDWAVVQVQDHGIGIPAGDLPHIFERFHRAASVSGHLPGTGLGLSTWAEVTRASAERDRVHQNRAFLSPTCLAGARDVIEQHKGKIYVQSKEGHGSVFTLRLPINPEEIDGAKRG